MCCFIFDTSQRCLQQIGLPEVKILCYYSVFPACEGGFVEFDKNLFSCFLLFLILSPFSAVMRACFTRRSFSRGGRLPRPVHADLPGSPPRAAAYHSTPGGACRFGRPRRRHSALFIVGNAYPVSLWWFRRQSDRQNVFRRGEHLQVCAAHLACRCAVHGLKLKRRNDMFQFLFCV